jgi:hypothetical protein
MEAVFGDFGGGEVKDSGYLGGGDLGRKEWITLFGGLFPGQFRFDERGISYGLGGEERSIFPSFIADNYAIGDFADGL